MSENEIKSVEAEASDTKKERVEIDPAILLECSGFTENVIEGYINIYTNFQKILWTMVHKGVPMEKAAAVTTEIVNLASSTASNKVPHGDPFTTDDEIDLTEVEANEVDN